MFKRYVFSSGLSTLYGSNGDYLINILGQVKDKLGNDIPVSRDINDHKVVHCRSWDGLRDYRIIDLIVIQFKSLQIPERDFNKVIAFVADNDTNNTHAKNVGYRFQQGKLEVEGCPGFYYVPSLTRVGVNSNGQVLDTKTKKLKNLYVTKPIKKTNATGGYFLAGGIQFCPGVFTGLGRHRMLCLVFKDYPNNVDNMTVNHIDGIPGNDSLDNLEWATQSENIRHAHLIGLHTANCRVLVRNVLTGEVREYSSLVDCGRNLGFSDVTISSKLRNYSFCEVFYDGLQFKLKNDERDWVIPKDPRKAIEDARWKCPMLVRNCATLAVTLYPSQWAASKETEVNLSSIRYRLMVDNRTPLCGYQFQLESDRRPWLDFTQSDYIASFPSQSYFVSARNLLTNETKEFSSRGAACDYFKNSSINAGLPMGRQPLLDSGWQFKYSHHEWEDIPDIEEAIYKRTRNITAKDENTGKLYIANSTRQLANILNLDRKEIRKAALTRGNKVYNGHRFRLGVGSEPWPKTNVT